MEFEKLSKLSDNKKREILAHLIKNDVIYWKKIMILLAMSEEDDTEMLDLVIENKIKEINLANSKFNLGLNKEEIQNTSGDHNYTKVMEMLLGDNLDSTYSIACKQVLEILNHIPSNYCELINKKFLERLEQLADVNYELKIHQDLLFEKLELLEETKEILELISYKFWSNDAIKVNIADIFNKAEG